MSSNLDGPNTGGASSSGRCWPLGRTTSVPLTTTEDARPWYPTGRCSQFGMSAFSGPRNMVPTLVACCRDE